jgi:F0F1-type ATP synthase gamma subunit
MDEKNEFKIKDENLTQKIIDPSTGKDITGEYVNQRLRELEKVADEIIHDALKKFQEHEADKVDIYQNAYWEIHEKLGMGSIGPATAAAGPLMERKKEKLAKLLEIDDDNLE